MAYIVMSYTVTAYAYEKNRCARSYRHTQSTDLCEERLVEAEVDAADIVMARYSHGPIQSWPDTVMARYSPGPMQLSPYTVMALYSYGPI